MTSAARLSEMARECLSLPGDLGLRATALLARQAIEAAVAAALEAEGIDATRLAFRTQLECLEHLRELGDVPTDAAFTWAALSRATHFHGYELPPTASALEGWLETVERVVEAVRQGRR